MCERKKERKKGGERCGDGSAFVIFFPWWTHTTFLLLFIFSMWDMLFGVSEASFVAFFSITSSHGDGLMAKRKALSSGEWSPILPVWAQNRWTSLSSVHFFCLVFLRRILFIICFNSLAFPGEQLFNELVCTLELESRGR